MMARRYAVLRCGLNHAQVLSLLEGEFRRLQDDHHLDFSYDYSEDDADTRQEIWLERGAEEAIVRLVNYRPISMSYLVLESVDDRKMQHMAALLDGLPIQTLATLQASARDRMDRDPTVLIRLAVGAGDEADAVSQSLLVGALTSDVRTVRLAGAMAAGVTQWPDLVAALETAAAVEGDDGVRRMIHGALSCCRPEPDDQVDEGELVRRV
jgi:hypothetical protein